MAYLGKIDLREVAPNHPWARRQISFGLNTTDNSNNSSPTTKHDESSISLVQAVENFHTRMWEEAQRSRSEQPTSPESSEKPE